MKHVPTNSFARMWSRASRSLFRFPVLLAATVALAACDSTPSDTASPEEVAAWEARAANVEIIRDDWGVPHIYAPTDADAVFGLMYAQAEDDFNRIEMNFLTSLGRTAEAMGEENLWQDLRMRLFIDPLELQSMYAESPAWLQQLMDGWADGLNYYLHTHPETEPRVLDRFEPWMALSFSEGSIGGDIERVSLNQLEDFYGDPEASMQGDLSSGGTAGATAAADADDAEGTMASSSLRHPRMAMAGAPASPADVATAGTWSSGLERPDPWEEPRGSNGIAVGPQNTVDGNSILLINPHTSFFFRHEAHVVSDEGLNAYGALTWGQFFVYQGFNETAGWMHTSSSVDNIDEFAEEVVEQEDGLFYRYGEELRAVEVDTVTVRVRQADGSVAERTFRTYRTHHGPIVRTTDQSGETRWVATALMEEPMRALIQSFSRTKAANLDEYLEVMETHTNSSNNTIFADAEGNYAYLHSNFVPVRDTRFDYDQPVDGSNPATDWNGVHSLEESPNAINPATGFAFGTNNWPYSAGGVDSPAESDYPAYMDRGEENWRGIHALRLLPGKTDFTVDEMVATAYSPMMPYFDDELPQLFAAYDAMPGGAEKEALEPVIQMLRAWDVTWGTESVETAVAIYYADELGDHDSRPAALRAALDRLTGEFGQWETPWGEINRFQRITGDIQQDFDDSAPSTPVGFVSSRWGSLASFGARQYPGTERWYGTSGNSFVAVVAFGDSLRARAVTAGGLNNDPASPHFNDQAERYAEGNLRTVRFYRGDVEANADQTYRPGEPNTVH